MKDAIESSGSPIPGSGALRMGAVLGLLGVGLGAFGAHGLQGLLDDALVEAAERAKRIGWWETAAHYQLVHAAVIVAMGALPRRPGAAPLLMSLGVLVFSGTLYAMALGAPRWFGAITPIGGVLMMAGWLVLLLRAKPGRGPGPAPVST